MSHDEVRVFKKGKVVCTQGSAMDSLFVLRQGKVEVLVNVSEESPSAKTIQRRGVVVEQIHTPGAVVGEAGWFVHYRTASLRAAESPTSLQTVEVGDGGAVELVTKDPQFGLALCRSLTARWGHLVNRVRSVSEATATIRSVYGSLALAYMTFVDSLADSPLSSEIEQVISEARQSPVYFAARAIKDQGVGRANSLRLMNEELSRQQAGLSRVPAGTELCKQGDAGEVVYLVREGRLKVSVGGQKVATVEPGEFAGEEVVLLPSPARRIGAIKAEIDSMVAAIPRDPFLEIVVQRPEILVSLSRALCERIEMSYRMGSQMGSLIEEELSLLAAAPDSCEFAFMQLLRALPSGREFKLVAKRAKAQAERALRMRKDMAKSYPGTTFVTR